MTEKKRNLVCLLILFSPLFFESGSAKASRFVDLCYYLVRPRPKTLPAAEVIDRLRAEGYADQVIDSLLEKDPEMASRIAGLSEDEGRAFTAYRGVKVGAKNFDPKFDGASTGGYARTYELYSSTEETGLEYAVKTWELKGSREYGKIGTLIKMQFPSGMLKTEKNPAFVEYVFDTRLMKDQDMTPLILEKTEVLFLHPDDRPRLPGFVRDRQGRDGYWYWLRKADDDR
jgi:hypothetical protein